VPDCPSRSGQWFKFQHSGGVVLVKPEMLTNAKEWFRQMDVNDIDVSTLGLSDIDVGTLDVNDNDVSEHCWRDG
jgi:hypothetical protein